ncbi:hypothetical protein E2L07_05650 [Halalkalibacterium halodurans]|uniref:dUTP diphosphatase n=1 Tax=Halalkalibacterium halodurans TaxID=86665 RepID=UPI001067A966|nr:dUTP diphosphatase [Halalkalibacterium halodurans]TES56171.1 hypothetical protein E2L07_05650 [Halalkalibacterium halodurans]
MKLSRFFRLQATLDQHIKKRKGLEDKDLLLDKIQALQVELGELANEWRGFKFWSNKQTPEVEQEECDYCGEYVDHTRPSPFMGDSASMCKPCWDMTKETYASSTGEHIPEFEDYPHFRKKVANKLLEEYVDCLHFFLSIGNDLNINENMIFNKSGIPNARTLFALINRYVAEMWWVYHDKKSSDAAVKWFHAFEHYLQLGEVLGFAWEEVEEAYLKKNEINHERQESGY